MLNISHFNALPIATFEKNILWGSGENMFFQYLVQKWRTYILAVFSSEVEDKCSFNI